MTSYNVGVLPGDGIGPEVTREGLKVLQAVADLEGLQLNLVDYPYSSEYYLKT
ncbi:MAG: isocitrate/isopropylmalate dehydrogenase family protein, partial [Gemmatimonadetes bacterium]|nr:isocitrate/isopropylmalate dehydrogenase family protein [Gemmatimonadota bacterium]